MDNSCATFPELDPSQLFAGNGHWRAAAALDPYLSAGEDGFDPSEVSFDPSEVSFDPSEVNFDTWEVDFDISEVDLDPSEAGFDISEVELHAWEEDFDVWEINLHDWEVCLQAPDVDLKASAPAFLVHGRGVGSLLGRSCHPSPSGNEQDFECSKAPLVNCFDLVGKLLWTR